MRKHPPEALNCIQTSFQHSKSSIRLLEGAHKVVLKKHQINERKKENKKYHLNPAAFFNSFQSCKKVSSHAWFLPLRMLCCPPYGSACL